MVTVEPFGSVPLAGCCWKTLPGVALAGPAACSTLTVNPSPLRIDCAVACGSPTTLDTWTPPPDTKIVTLLPGAASVSAGGDSFTTVPLGLLEVGSDTMFTLKFLFSRVFWALACCWPTTSGTLTSCGPVDTSRVTTELGATLLPNAGFVLATWPLG